MGHAEAIISGKKCEVKVAALLLTTVVFIVIVRSKLWIQ